jgi:hypothetical protein
MNDRKWSGNLDQWIERLQKKLGRKLKSEEVAFLEWLNGRMEQRTKDQNSSSVGTGTEVE